MQKVKFGHKGIVFFPPTDISKEFEVDLKRKRDAAERDARDKETEVLSLTRELVEAYEKIEDLETKRKTMQNELDELANNQVRSE